MKIQIDQNGNTAQGTALTTKATGVLISRKGMTVRVDIGARVTPMAVFVAMSQLRILPQQIMIVSRKKTLSEFLTLDAHLKANEVCLQLGRLLLHLLEKRHPIFATKRLDLLDNDKVASLPDPLQKLGRLRLLKLPTSDALSHLDEKDMTECSFLHPEADSSYRVRKMPQSAIWPAPVTYLPLPLTEILSSPYALWFNSLCHIALCVKLPLCHIADIQLTVPDTEAARHRSWAQDDQIHSKWQQTIRILYPLAAPSEKPANYRLLMCAANLKTNKIIF